MAGFCGRTAELETLRQWILADRCRFITLFGMGGIGKTWLAAKLAEQVQPHFQSVVWRHLEAIVHPPLPSFQGQGRFILDLKTLRRCAEPPILTGDRASFFNKKG